jgi:hypothetical protein
MPSIYKHLKEPTVGEAMLDHDYWEEYEIELEPGTLYYRIESTSLIRPTDIVRSEFSSNKWFVVHERYTACIGYSIEDLAIKFKQAPFTEVLREYL